MARQQYLYLLRWWDGNTRLDVLLGESVMLIYFPRSFSDSGRLSDLPWTPGPRGTGGAVDRFDFG